jgi:hypothetical protein
MFWRGERGGENKRWNKLFYTNLLNLSFKLDINFSSPLLIHLFYLPSLQSPSFVVLWSYSIRAWRREKVITLIGAELGRKTHNWWVVELHTINLSYALLPSPKIKT